MMSGDHVTPQPATRPQHVTVPSVKGGPDGPLGFWSEVGGSTNC